MTAKMAEHGGGVSGIGGALAICCRRLLRAIGRWRPSRRFSVDGVTGIRIGVRLGDSSAGGKGRWFELLALILCFRDPAIKHGAQALQFIGMRGGCGKIVYLMRVGLQIV